MDCSEVGQFSRLFSVRQSAPSLCPNDWQAGFEKDSRGDEMMVFTQFYNENSIGGSNGSVTG